MKLRIFVHPSRLRRWHLILAERAAEHGFEVAFAFAEGGPTLPLSLRCLAGFERLAYGLAREGASERLSFDHYAGLTGDMPDPDWVLDLTPIGISTDLPGQRVLRLLFDGVADEAAAAAAVAERRLPHLSITDGTAAVRAEGIPAVEHPLFMTRCLDDIFTRAVTLVLKALNNHAALRPGSVVVPVSASAAPIVSFAALTLIDRIAEKLGLKRPSLYSWQIGWRPTSSDLELPAGEGWPVDSYRWLADDARRFYADPFPFEHDGVTYVFCEELKLDGAGRGVISVFEIGPDGAPGTPRHVLSRPYHLSYPFVFERDGSIWMIPDSAGNRTIDLYRAEAFPESWVLERTLVADVDASDATLIDHEGRLWLFASDKQGGLSWDTLCLWYAPSLEGPWTPHPLNPVLIDAGGARPAGHFMTIDGRLVRPAQDCRWRYGSGLVLKEVTLLDTERFEERPFIAAGSEASRMDGVHTLNRSAAFELIDRLGGHALGDGVKPR